MSFISDANQQLEYEIPRINFSYLVLHMHEFLLAVTFLVYRMLQWNRVIFAASGRTFGTQNSQYSRFRWKVFAENQYYKLDKQLNWSWNVNINWLKCIAQCVAKPKWNAHNFWAKMFDAQTTWSSPKPNVKSSLKQMMSDNRIQHSIPLNML